MLKESDHTDADGQDREGCVSPLPASTGYAVQGYDSATNRGDSADSGELLLGHSHSIGSHLRVAINGIPEGFKARECRLQISALTGHAQTTPPGG